MTAGCCPFCHIVLVLKTLEATTALFQCPACCYVVVVQIIPSPLMSNRGMPWPAR
jgi:hypothetical protein